MRTKLIYIYFCNKINEKYGIWSVFTITLLYFKCIVENTYWNFKQKLHLKQIDLCKVKWHPHKHRQINWISDWLEQARNLIQQIQPHVDKDGYSVLRFQTFSAIDTQSENTLNDFEDFRFDWSLIGENWNMEKWTKIELD